MAIAWFRISSKVIAHPPDAEAACSRRCGNGKSRLGSLYRRWGTKESRRPGRASRRRATMRAAGAGDPRAASLLPTRHDLAPCCEGLAAIDRLIVMVGQVIVLIDVHRWDSPRARP